MIAEGRLIVSRLLKGKESAAHLRGSKAGKDFGSPKRPAIREFASALQDTHYNYFCNLHRPTMANGTHLAL
jgi:hypothetical protein